NQEESYLKKTFNKLISGIAQYDNPPEAFNHVQYKVGLNISEANWHQLLRHNRKTNFTYGQPSVNNGLVIPPRIVQYGLIEDVKAIHQASKNLFDRIIQIDGIQKAAYFVLNAHKRRVVMSFSLWEAYHLYNLRTSEEAQWDIK